ncbi:hypothetical protein FJTKL_12412 [Diaporthe vaccinii]|uniref:Uncharacterized protein n=1 Tax=Diaporthe vaccinii TaxID=105482 RepID=A0ABR4EE72_9PEZI
MNPLPLREPRKAQRNRDRGPWSPFTPYPRRRCPSPRRTYRQGTAKPLRLGTENYLTFRISLFRTRQICWMSAADWETASRELPDRTSSSFWALEISTSTPDCMMTLRTSFSPMKFLFNEDNQPPCSHGIPDRP